MTPTDRRTFLKSCGIAAAGAALALGKETTDTGSTLPTRKLGRTGLRISEIGLGGSPAPGPGIFSYCLKKGVNWFDTSIRYQNGESEKTFGGYLSKIHRKKMIVGTKMKADAGTKAGEILSQAETSLGRLGIDTIDVYYHHSVNSLDQLKNKAVPRAFDKLKKQGKIRSTGVSLHTNTLKLLPEIISLNYHDVILVGFNVYRETDAKYENLLGKHGLEKLLEQAAKKDMGILAMKVQAGGNNQKLDKYLKDDITAAQAKILWALSFPFVSGVLTEINNIDEAKEDLAAPRLRLSADLRRRLDKYCRADSADYCRMCGLCHEACPLDIEISDIQRYLRYRTGYTDNLNRTAAALYRGIPTGRSAAACDGCGLCEAACPWNVAIRKNLNTAGSLLG